VKLPLTAHLALQVKLRAARDALANLFDLLQELHAQYREDPASRQFLLTAISWYDEADANLGFLDFQPQPEWMGGPTEGSDACRTKTYLREPHGTTTKPPRYFTAAEVDEARRVGLLAAGPDLTGPVE
jgi:hypothetical protein